MTRPRKVFWHLGEEIWTYADYPEKADLGNKPFDENRRFSDRLLPRLSRNRSSEITSFRKPGFQARPIVVVNHDSDVHGVVQRKTGDACAR